MKNWEKDWREFTTPAQKLSVHNFTNLTKSTVI